MACVFVFFFFMITLKLILSLYRSAGWLLLFFLNLFIYFRVITLLPHETRIAMTQVYKSTGMQCKKPDNGLLCPKPNHREVREVKSVNMKYLKLCLSHGLFVNYSPKTDDKTCVSELIDEESILTRNNHTS